MARPAEFDRDEAVASAIRVFARHGYEAASTSDLLEAMRIGRQSLYGAFGDKRRLFLEALKRYSAASLDEMRQALAGGATAAEDLKAALVVGLGRAEDLETGCLGVGSIAEFGRSDPEVSALNDAASKDVVAAFAARIQEGVEGGEFDPGLDVGAAGRMLLALRSGLKIAARGGADDGEIRKLALLGLQALKRR